jgi:hypothetical protein
MDALDEANPLLLHPHARSSKASAAVAPAPQGEGVPPPVGSKPEAQSAMSYDEVPASKMTIKQEDKYLETSAAAQTKQHKQQLPQAPPPELVLNLLQLPDGLLDAQERELMGSIAQKQQVMEQQRAHLLHMMHGNVDAMQAALEQAMPSQQQQQAAAQQQQQQQQQQTGYLVSDSFALQAMQQQQQHPPQQFAMRDVSESDYSQNSKGGEGEGGGGGGGSSSSTSLSGSGGSGDSAISGSAAAVSPPMAATGTRRGTNQSNNQRQRGQRQPQTQSFDGSHGFESRAPSSSSSYQQQQERETNELRRLARMHTRPTSDDPIDEVSPPPPPPAAAAAAASSSSRGGGAHLPRKSSVQSLPPASLSTVLPLGGEGSPSRSSVAGGVIGTGCGPILNGVRTKRGQGVSCHSCKTSKDTNSLFHCQNKGEKGVKKRRCRKKVRTTPSDCESCHISRLLGIGLSLYCPMFVCFCCGFCAVLRDLLEALLSLLSPNRSRSASHLDVSVLSGAMSVRIVPATGGGEGSHGRRRGSWRLGGE